MINKLDLIELNVVKINHSEIQERLKSISLTLGNNILEIIKQEKLKIKIEKSIEFSTLFNEEITEIMKAFYSHNSKISIDLKMNLASIGKRAKEFNDMMHIIQNYPLKNITNQLKREAEEQGVESFNAIKFIKEVNKSIINLIVYYTVSFEDRLINKLFEEEEKKINSDYYVNNKALSTLNPYKHKAYLMLVYKGIKAFYLDFKSFVNIESEYNILIENFFLKVIKKVESLIELNNNLEPLSNFDKNVDLKNVFPSHIFRNKSAFNLFKELVIVAKTQEEVGFYFRIMSESEKPMLITVKEVMFRNWFNQESGHDIELKNPIKTLSRMKNISSKQRFYSLIKTKYFENGVELENVA